MISVHARLWPAFRSALSSKAILVSPVQGIFMPIGSRVLEFQRTQINTPSDLPSVVQRHKGVCVRPFLLRQADPAWNGSCNASKWTWRVRSDISPCLRESSGRRLCRRQRNRHRWMVHLQASLVCRNVGLRRSPDTVALLNQRSTGKRATALASQPARTTQLPRRG